MNEIVIVYAFSGALYAKLTSVSMSSVMLNNKKSRIHFILLVDSEYQDEEGIFEEIKAYKNCDITFVPINEFDFKNAELHIPHINHATYFRLLLPELFPQIDKCLYLDCDTIVNSDISELNDIQLDNYLIGGVLAAGYVNNPKGKAYCEKVGINNLESYVNAGVLLFNLKLMREERISYEFMKYIACDFPSQDQDIINKVCYGRILLLSAKFNVMTKYAEWLVEEYGEKFDYGELVSAWNFPTIIHYADRIKPWNEPDSFFASEWWEVCCKTNLYKDFIYNAGQYHIYESLYNSSKLVDEKIKKKVPALYSLNNKRIVLYGAGNFANAFINLYRPLGIDPEYIIVTKKIKGVDDIQGIPIIEFNDISLDNRDISLVLALNYTYQKQVIPMLSQYHFREILPLTDKMLSLEKEYIDGK